MLADRPDLVQGMYEVARLAYPEMGGYQARQAQTLHDWQVYHLGSPGTALDMTPVAVADGEVIGFATMIRRADGRTVEHRIAAVRPDWRRRGIARLLLLAQLAAAKRDGLETVIAWGGPGTPAALYGAGSASRRVRRRSTSAGRSSEDRDPTRLGVRRPRAVGGDAERGAPRRSRLRGDDGARPCERARARRPARLRGRRDPRHGDARGRPRVRRIGVQLRRGDRAREAPRARRRRGAPRRPVRACAAAGQERARHGVARKRRVLDCVSGAARLRRTRARSQVRARPVELRGAGPVTDGRRRGCHARRPTRPRPGHVRGGEARLSRDGRIPGDDRPRPSTTGRSTTWAARERRST